MRAQLTATAPGVRAIPGTAEAMGLQDGCAEPFSAPRRPFDARLFSGLEETCFDYQHVGSAQQVILDRFLSVSFIAALPEEQNPR